MKTKIPQPRYCSVDRATELHKLKVNHISQPVWYHLLNSKNNKILLNMGNGIYFDMDDECLLDDKELLKNKQKILAAYTLSNLTEILKDAPINWQYFYSRQSKQWIISDFHQTKVVKSDTLENGFADMLIYLVQNDFFEKLKKENHEDIVPKQKPSLKRSTGKSPDVNYET